MFTHSLRRTAAIAAAVAGTIAAGLATPASAHPTTSGQIQAELSAARQYSAPFHTTDLAAAGGWQKLPLPCFDNPGTGDNNGGMGNHWILDPATLGNAPVAGEPNILVFDPVTNKLVAVEYVELQSAASAAPSLFGQTFEPSNLPDGTPIYELHAYVWKPNPNGMFHEYNPDVHLCPTA
jgi:hypothetical protein